MIKGIAFGDYPVSDTKRARQFYEHILGLPLDYNYQEEWLEYSGGGGTFAITTMDIQHLPGRRGAVIAFEVADLDVTRQKLQEHRGELLSEVAVMSVCRSFAVADPDGNEIILHRRNAA